MNYDPEQGVELAQSGPGECDRCQCIGARLYRLTWDTYPEQDWRYCGTCARTLDRIYHRRADR